MAVPMYLWYVPYDSTCSKPTAIQFYQLRPGSRQKSVYVSVPAITVGRLKRGSDLGSFTHVGMQARFKAQRSGNFNVGLVGVEPRRTWRRRRVMAC